MKKLILFVFLLFTLAFSQPHHFYRLQLDEVSPNQISNQQLLLTEQEFISLLNNNPSVFFKLPEVIIRVPASTSQDNEPQNEQKDESKVQIKIVQEQQGQGSAAGEGDEERNKSEMKEAENQNSGSQNDGSKNEDEDEGQEVTSDPGLDAPRKVQRKYLLYLINKLRKNNSASPLKLDGKLNMVAQNHSLDMIQRRYFSHRNPDNQGPGDRARAAGINQQIGENIAISFSLTQADKQLENSPGHFNNSVNPIYETVGFGIAVDSSRRLFLTVLLSTRNLEKNPITNEEFADLEEKIVNLVIERNPSIAREDKGISESLKVWQSSNRSQNLFSFLRRMGHSPRFISMSNYYYPYSNRLVEDVRKRNIFTGVSNRFNSVSLSLGIFEGRVQMLAIFTG